MAGMFSKPKLTPPKVVEPPTVDEARSKIEGSELARRRKGRAATMLVSAESGVSTAAKALTGN